MVVNPLELTEVYLHLQVMGHNLYATAPRLGFRVLFHLAVCSLRTAIFFLLSWPHGLQPTRVLHPWDLLGKSTGVGCHRLLWSVTASSGNLLPYILCTYIVELFSYSMDLMPGHQLSKMVLCHLFNGKMWCLISWRYIKGWTLLSISAPPQKLRVTGNLISCCGALLLLLQYAALFTSSSLDSALLRVAFSSVLLIYIFGKASLCGRIWGVEKDPWPKYSSVTGYSDWNACKKLFIWTFLLGCKAMLECKYHSREARYWVIIGY